MQIRSSAKIICTCCPHATKAVALAGSCLPGIRGLVLCPQLYYSSALLSYTTPLVALIRDPRRAGVLGV